MGMWKITDLDLGMTGARYIKKWTGMRVIECIRKTEERYVWNKIVQQCKCPNGKMATGMI